MGKYLLPIISAFLLIFGGTFIFKQISTVKKNINTTVTTNSKTNTSPFGNTSLFEPLYDPAFTNSSDTEPKEFVVQPKYCLYAPVIFYHHIQPMDIAEKYKQEYLTVEPSTFESHIKYLKSKKYNFISAETLVNAVNNERTLPAKSIVLTIDDGYSDAYGYAFKVAKDYKVTINVMLITSLIGKGGYLTWDEIKEMRKSKLVYFYNHSADHYDMTYLNKDQATYAVLSAQKILDDTLHNIPRIFVYPSGFYTDTALQVLKENGFIGAFGTESGSSQCDTNILHLQRIRIGNVSIDNYGF